MSCNSSLVYLRTALESQSSDVRNTTMKDIDFPSNWHLNSDGSYDVYGSVILSKKYVRNGKLTVKFGKVTGTFKARGIGLTSLDGCPKKIAGYFDCSFNKLTTLKGAPKEIGGEFNCAYNKLTTLEGGPKKVGGYYNCSENKLTSLKGAPGKINGDFDCSYNQLTFLKEAPKK